MKIFLIILSLFVSSFLLSGCQIQNNQPKESSIIEKTGVLQVKKW